MIYKIDNEWKYPNELDQVIDILNSLSIGESDVFLILMGHLEDDYGDVVNGIYKAFNYKLYRTGLIYLNMNMPNYSINKLASVLVHEYAHHLSQASHCHLLFGLYNEWLAREVGRRIKIDAR